MTAGHTAIVTGANHGIGAATAQALAGIIEDATSLSFVSTSHFEGSRGGRLASRRHAVLRQHSHISTGYPYTTSADVNADPQLSST